MESLPGLKRILDAFRSLEHSSISDRFNQELISKWSSVINSLVSKYGIPGKLDGNDFKQELLQHMWKLTQRIDPVSQATDFERLCRTELKNKCIDLTRHVKARKRVARTGKAVQCLCCGSVTRVSITDNTLYCHFCGESKNIREVETYSRDISMNHDNEDGTDSLPTSYEPDLLGDLLVKEFIDRIDVSLDYIGKRVMELFVMPSNDYLAYLLDNGYTGDHRQASIKLMSIYLGVSDKEVASKITDIKLAVEKIIGGSISQNSINRASSRQGR